MSQLTLEAEINSFLLVFFLSTCLNKHEYLYLTTFLIKCSTGLLQSFCNVFVHKTLARAHARQQLIFSDGQVKATLMICDKSYRICSHILTSQHQNYPTAELQYVTNLIGSTREGSKRQRFQGKFQIAMVISVMLRILHYIN